MKNVIIIGTGGHAKVVSNIVLCSGDYIEGFLTSEQGIDTFLDRPILGKDTDYKKYIDCYFILAIGNAAVRERLAQYMRGAKWYTAIHPSAVISPMHTFIGEGSAIMPNVVINPYVKIGEHCIINSSAVIEHDNVIESFAHISVGAKLAGSVSVGEKTWIGVGATVSNEISICKNCMIGAGAVVVKNIKYSGTYVGVPAKRL